MVKNGGKIKFLILLLILSGLCFGNRVFGLTDDQINDEIQQLNGEIKSNKDKLEDIENKKEQYARSIKEKQAEANNLKNQVAILDNRIAKAELDIEDVKGRIDETGLEIKKTKIEISAKTEAINKEKGNIANVLRLMYRENDVSALEILLLNDSLADFLNRVKYLEDINKEMGDSLDNLKKYKSDLERQKIELDAKNEELANLKDDLERSKIALEEEKQDKDFLLAATKNSEQEYQNLLVLAKQEQEAAAAEIVSLEAEVREKVESLNKEKLEFNDNGLIWPVPSRHVTSYFHDPDYPFRYIFEHPAVDIRAGQGTPVKAAASGYVARVKLEGKAYGYIMLIHGDGLSTVYGHISKAMVNEEDYVVQGQVIAASGGLPGTTGAGRMTSGPHLHFEVRSEGVPVNPLEYLP